MKRLCCILLVTCMAFGAILPVWAVDASPFDASVDAVMDAVAVSVGNDTAGAAVVLYKNGGIVMSDGFGYADLNAKTLVTASTVFEVGGLSPLFVAISALTLAEQGALSLTADIAEYLPADFMAKLSLAHPVTLSHLLSGRAGFDGRIFDLSFDKESHCFETLEEALLADVPRQIVAPGTMYSPSPFGVALAAFVVQTVSGVPYNTYVTDKVFMPLGMKDTCPLVTETAPTGYAVGYVAAEQGNFTASHNGGRTYAGLYPATGALSTAADLAKLITWLLDGSDAVLSQKTKAELFNPQRVGVFSPASLGFAASGDVCICKTNTTCFGASLALDPTKGEAVLVLTNTASSALLDLPTTLLSAAPTTPTMPTGEPVELKELRGTYTVATLEQRSFVGRLASAENRIMVKPNDDGTLAFGELRMVQIARGVFANADDVNTPVLQFLFDAEGKVIGAVTPTGVSYEKLPFYYAEVPMTLMLGVLMILTVGFLLLGVFGLFEWLAKRGRKGEHMGLLCLLPELLSALLSLFVGAQILAAYKLGAGMLSSFYFAMRVLTLLVGIGATVAYVLAFVLTVLDRKQHHRIAYSSFIYLGYVFLICFFGLALI